MKKRYRPAPRFLPAKAADYEQQRDLPAVEGTSRLSPCTAVGALSPRQCLHRLLVEQPRALDGEAGAVWLNELIWREFYRHLMVYYPNLCKVALLSAGPITWRGWMINPRFRHGSAGKPVSRLSMPPCVSLIPLGGCITACG